MPKKLKPTAAGNFNKTPFAHILIYLHEKRLSGTLDICFGETTVCIYFKDGTPAKVQTDVPKRGLGHVLLALGQITGKQLADCNAYVRKKGCLQGKAFTDLRILDVNALVLGLKKQIILKMTDVFAMSDASYCFYNKVNKLEGFGPDEIFPIHPYTVIMSGLRTYPNKLNLKPILAPLEGRRLALQKEIEKIKAFRLSTQEKLFVQFLLENNGACSFPQILTQGQWKPETAKYVLYALRIAKLLVLSETAPTIENGNTNAKGLSSASAPPFLSQSDDPKIEDEKKAILTKAEEITSQNYYEMLGIDPDAAAEDARRAYFILSKKFHPDKLHPDVRSALKEAVDYVFSNLTNAHAVLINPEAKEQYDAALLQEQKDTARKTMDERIEVRDALDAENLFQRALVFLNKGETDKAEELVSSSLTMMPDEGEYSALAAHLRVIKRKTGEPLGDLETKLRQAAAQCPKSERVNFYLADILKRQEKWAEAKEYFRRTLALNPHNIDAARGIRLIEMQEKKTQTEQKGFFKRLLK